MNNKRHEQEINAFGEKLKQTRRSKKLSQIALAQKSGLEFSQISRIERGIINTSLRQIFIIAEALEVSAKDFFD